MAFDGFTSPSKAPVLQIFIALKNQSPSAGIEPANLGSNGKHTSHYTTEDNFNTYKSLILCIEVHCFWFDVKYIYKTWLHVVVWLDANWCEM
jgi:hypothetical protein